MKKFRYKKVNAFTSENSRGNPAAYLLADDGVLSPDEMLAIGREHSGFVSEVVFCSPSRAADLKLTYFSSECEVEFCGHGTIATMYDRIMSDDRLRAMSEIHIETNRKGILTVYNSIANDGAVYITAPAARHLSVPADAGDIADALGAAAADFDASWPVDFIDAGLRTLIVPLAKLEKEVSIYPSESGLKEFCLSRGIDIVLVFCKETSDADCFAHTRVFAPKFGYLEDPATGSGNSAFACYLLKLGEWGGAPVTVEQGGANIKYNPVRLKSDGTNVLFGGAASVVIDGWYYV